MGLIPTRLNSGSLMVYIFNGAGIWSSTSAIFLSLLLLLPLLPLMHSLMPDPVDFFKQIPTVIFEEEEGTTENCYCNGNSS